MYVKNIYINKNERLSKYLCDFQPTIERFSI